MIKSIAIIGLIVSLVFLAGCTQQAPVDIQQLPGAITGQATEAADTAIEQEVQNAGDVTSDDIEAAIQP